MGKFFNQHLMNTKSLSNLLKPQRQGIIGDQKPPTFNTMRTEFNNLSKPPADPYPNLTKARETRRLKREQNSNSQAA